MSHKTITNLIRLNIVALVLAIIWMVSNPDFEPLISAITLICTLIGLKHTQASKEKKEDSNTTMVQNSGNHSTNYQAKGNITITPNNNTS